MILILLEKNIQDFKYLNFNKILTKKFKKILTSQKLLLYLHSKNMLK